MTEVKNYKPKRRTDKSKDEAERKSQYVIFRLTSTEKEAVLTRAWELGIPVSEYCRALVLGHVPENRSDEEREFRRNLVGEATNLNQIAKYLNTFGLYPELEESIRAIVARLAQQVL